MSEEIEDAVEEPVEAADGDPVEDVLEKPDEPERPTALAQRDERALLAERLEKMPIENGLILCQTAADVSVLARVISMSGQAIPAKFRGQPSLCFAVAMQSMQWRMDPWAVIRGAYVVNDTVAYESRIFSAAIRSLAPIVDLPDYEYEGEGDKRKCTVKFYLSAERVRTYTTPELGKIHPKNSPLWKTDPDQQLAYFATRSGARLHFPDILAGAYDYEEVRSVRSANTAELSGIAERLKAPDGGFSANTVDSGLGELQGKDT